MGEFFEHCSKALLGIIGRGLVYSYNYGFMKLTKLKNVNSHNALVHSTSTTAIRLYYTRA